MLGRENFLRIVLIFLTIIFLSNLYISLGEERYSFPLVKSMNKFPFLKFEDVETKFLSAELIDVRRYQLISNCNKVTFPYNLMIANRWQNVDQEKSLLVFSAYQEGQEVNIIGAAIRKGTYVCQLWYTSSNTSTLRLIDAKATIERFPEGHGKKYTASRITCHVSKRNVTGRLLAVSISKSKCQQPINVLPVVRNENFGITNNFTLCVAPFSNEYAGVYELVEWIEFNRILGADKFVFYNLSSSPEIAIVLKSYTTNDLIEVIDWKLPMTLAKSTSNYSMQAIHYNGQMASLNDCLLRSRGRSKFIVNIDLDEIIIPRLDNTTTWEEMFKSLSESDIYLFSNVFFRKEWNDSRTDFSGYDIAKKLNLVTLLYLKRERRIFSIGQRSKYITRPEAVRTLGIHRIHYIRSKLSRSINVPHEVALLQHYRNWMKYDDHIKRVDDDIIVKKYKDKLLNNVVQKWKSLPQHISRNPV